MANKVVQLVDKNSNNLYPVAGAVITDAVSTGAISNQAVTNPKIDWSTIITLTSTDPGEGQPLAANNFIGVYEA